MVSPALALNICCFGLPLTRRRSDLPAFDSLAIRTAGPRFVHAPADPAAGRGDRCDRTHSGKPLMRRLFMPLAVTAVLLVRPSIAQPVAPVPDTGGDAARGATPADFRTTVAGTRCGHHHRGSAASARDRTRSVSDARDLSTRGANGCRTGARDQRSARRDGRRNPSGSNPFGSNPFGTDPADAASFRDRFGEIRHTSREIPGGSDCFRPAADTSVVAGSLAHRFSPCRAWSGSRRPER